MRASRWIRSNRFTRQGGRREWLRLARRELEQQRERDARAIPRDREDRLLEAARRLDEDHQVKLAANDGYERWRAGARDTLGRRLKGNSKPYVPAELPDGTINLSDPDSRVMRTQGTPPRQPTTRRPRSTTGRSSLRPRSASMRPTLGTWHRCSRRRCVNCASRA